MTYEDALQYCKNLTPNGGLAEIINEDTQYFLTGVLVTKQLYLHDHWWIGANDRKEEGKWIWEHSGNEVAYNNWRVGEPNDFGGQDCGLIWFLKDGFAPMSTWDDEVCSSLKPKPICQKFGI